MKIILILVLFGVSQSFHPVSSPPPPKLTIHFEIGSNLTETYLADIQQIISAVCENKGKVLKVDVFSNKHVEVFVNDSIRELQGGNFSGSFNIDELSLESPRMKNMSFFSCGDQRTRNELGFTVIGTEGSVGNILLEVVSNKEHRAIELYYEFAIKDDDGFSIDVSEFEKVRNLVLERAMFHPDAYNHSYEISFAMSTSNYTATLIKCGFVVLSIDPLMTDNQFILNEETLQMLDEVSDSCDQNNTKLEVYVEAGAGTTGTITIRVIKNRDDDDDDSDFFMKIIHALCFFFLVFIACPALCYLERLEEKEMKKEAQASDVTVLTTI